MALDRLDKSRYQGKVYSIPQPPPSRHLTSEQRLDGDIRIDAS
jgi:hypothetical protein